MARTVTPLCPERHYLGSSASGRFSTDRSVRPCYVHLPTPEELARFAGMRTANRTRYLREQDALGWVLACEAARRTAERLQAQLDALPSDAGASANAACEAAVPSEPGLAGDPKTRELARLQARLEQAVARRKEASRQLRLMGVSPKAQARIFEEVRRRVRAIG